MRSRFCKIAISTIFVIIIGCATVGCSVNNQSSSDESCMAYLFVHFANAEANYIDEQIYFSVSVNGKDWTTLNDGKPVLLSTVGEHGVRDPHIIRNHSNNGYYIVATDLSIHHGHRYSTDRIDGVGLRDQGWGAAQTNGSLDIIVWESIGTSLAKWSTPRSCAMALENASCVWAPEIIWDDEYDGGNGAYMLYWASKSDGEWVYRIYRSYTSDFVTFTTPELYIDSGASCIDLTIVKDGEWYYRFCKDEARRAILMEKGRSLSGTFEAVSTFNIDGASGEELSCYEGPTCYKLFDSNKWCLLLDNYTGSLGGGYMPYITDDLSTGNFVCEGQFNFDGTYRHGTVMPITQSEYDELTLNFCD